MFLQENSCNLIYRMIKLTVLWYLGCMKCLWHFGYHYYFDYYYSCNNIYYFVYNILFFPLSARKLGDLAAWIIALWGMIFPATRRTPSHPNPSTCCWPRSRCLTPRTSVTSICLILFPDSSLTVIVMCIYLWKEDACLKKRGNGCVWLFKKYSPHF